MGGKGEAASPWSSEAAVNGLSGVADQIGHSARALAERVNRFRV